MHRLAEKSSLTGNEIDGRSWLGRVVPAAPVRSVIALGALHDFVLHYVVPLAIPNLRWMHAYFDGSGLADFPVHV